MFIIIKYEKIIRTDMLAQMHVMSIDVITTSY
jgi:hypothetical protein